MPPLVEIQHAFWRAVVENDIRDVADFLVGGREPSQRIAIHRRHYETSLVTALLGKFPATIWLVGSQPVTEAARVFVRRHPPETPCIAEYGRDFPRFLALQPAADRVAFLTDFAELEWRVGQTTIAVEQPALPLSAISGVDGHALMDAALTMQQGLHYLHAAWPIDELMTLYVTDSAPYELDFSPGEAWLEIRGAYGEFRIDRLQKAEFRFRAALSQGVSIGVSAERAMQDDPAFDPGISLVQLVREGLVTALIPSSGGTR